MTNALTNLGFGLAVSAGFVYLLLRFVVATPGAANVVDSVSRHAFWTALIGFFASGTSGLMNLWAYPDPQNPSDSDVPALIMHAAAPGLWLGLVYILGQFTWPRHLAPVRSASLEVRSLKAVIPKALATVLLACAALSTVLVVLAWNDPGAAHRAGTDDGSGVTSGIEYGFTQPWDGTRDEYGNPLDEWGNMMNDEELEAAKNWVDPQDIEQVSSIAGTKPGSEVGPYLAGGLALVLIGSLAATGVIVRRPPLQNLDAEDNATLRAIWINRLLRTAAFVVSGFGMASLSYMAEGIRARSEWVTSTAQQGYSIDHQAEAAANWLTGGGTLWMLLIAVLLFAWKPPRLTNVAGRYPFGDPIDETLSSPAYARARDFLVLAQGVGLLMAFVALGVFGLLASSANEAQDYDQSSWMSGYDSASPVNELPTYALMLAAVAGTYLLVQLLAAYIIRRRLGNGVNPEQPRTALLPPWFIVIVSLALATALASGTDFLFSTAPEARAAAGWMLGLLLFIAVLAGLLHRSATHRPALAGANEREDHEIRVIMAHRGARMLGGISLITASVLANDGFWSSDTLTGAGPVVFQIITLVLGVVLCCLPAVTVVSHRGATADVSP